MKYDSQSQSTRHIIAQFLSITILKNLKQMVIFHYTRIKNRQTNYHFHKLSFLQIIIPIHPIQITECHVMKGAGAQKVLHHMVYSQNKM